MYIILILLLIIKLIVLRIIFIMYIFIYSAGGIILSACDARIVLNQTLDE